MAAIQTLLIIRTLTNPGEKILGNRWLPFVDALRGELAAFGREAPESSDELLLFLCADTAAVVPGLFRLLERTKKAHNWQAASGPVPLQVVLDGREASYNYRDPGLWGELEHEVFYVAGDLLRQWPQVAEAQQLACELRPFSSQFGQLVFSSRRKEGPERLLAYRGLPVAGKGKECFYCGMPDHPPANCPSHNLAMATSGLEEVGYLSFAEVNSLYKKVFPLDASLIGELAQGVRPADLRHKKHLLLAVSFFDLLAVYQQRFLWAFAFAPHSKWDELSPAAKQTYDNRNLHMGLDCLRVGKYDQASDLLHAETKKKGGNGFAANIGLAFWALEKQRSRDMGRFLEEARSKAHRTTQIIYVNLLLSRYYELQKDYWNAKEAVNNALKADYDCLDVQYRRLQLAVREGLSAREFKQLRTLALGQKDYFIRALLDPHFLPIQGMVEDSLRGHFKALIVDASENLQSAEVEWRLLKVWLDKNDRQLLENKKGLDKLASQLKRRSYYDILDVVERSKGIYAICNRLRRAKVEQLQADLHKKKKLLEAYQRFWTNFRYKQLYREFLGELTEARKQRQEASRLIKSADPEAIHQAMALLKGLQKRMKGLQQQYQRMGMVQSVFHSVLLFVKRLVIVQLVLLLTVALFFPLLGMVAASSPDLAWAADLAGNGQLMKKSLLISAFFVAPFVAFCWTAMELQKLSGAKQGTSKRRRRSR